MGSMEVRADSLGTGEVAQVSVRAVASGDVSGVMQMLAAIESAPQLLAVRSVRIDQPEPDASPATMERLQLTLVVEGLLLTPRMEKGS
jgi:acylphosphatase